MPKFLRHHTVVVSYLALFLAVGGGAAYAQQRLMFSGLDVMDESLTSDDLALGSVGTSEVAYGALTKNDLATDSVGAAELDLDVQKVTKSSYDFASNKTVTATCPPGYTVLGGGGGFSSNPEITMTNSAPSGTTGWSVSAQTISFPAQKTNWDHRHDGDSVADVVWKDWVWKSSDFKGEWGLSATAICAQL